MDELEFRRRAYAEPDCTDPAFKDYVPSAEEKQFLEELHMLDDSLKQALQVQPPHDLPERIKLKQALNDHQQSRQRMRQWSVAASVVIFLLALFAFLPVHKPDYSPVAQEVLQHIYHELNHLHDQKNTSLSQINQMLSGFGGHLENSIGQVNYLGSCDIGQSRGVHLVVQGEIGPVTILMLPAYRISSRQSFSDQRFKGLLMPSGQGSIAIVGEQGESLQKLQSQLTEYMSWI